MAQHLSLPAECYTIAEFCAAFRLSRRTFYNMRAEGVGPEEFRCGPRWYITKLAAQRWLAARERADQPRKKACAR